MDYGGAIGTIGRGGRSFLIINFFIEWGLKMIEFKIQLKKIRIFTQRNIHLIEHSKFNRIIHSKEFNETYSKFQ